MRREEREKGSAGRGASGAAVVVLITVDHELCAERAVGLGARCVGLAAGLDTGDAEPVCEGLGRPEGPAAPAPNLNHNEAIRPIMW